MKLGQDGIASASNEMTGNRPSGLMQIWLKAVFLCGMQNCEWHQPELRFSVDKE